MVKVPTKKRQKMPFLKTYNTRFEIHEMLFICL